LGPPYFFELILLKPIIMPKKIAYLNLLINKEYMRQIILVGVGSFLGGIARYISTLVINQKLNTDFPYATLSINIFGCLLIGIVYGIFEKSIITCDWKLFLATGICGGFTTFSAFSNESLDLLKQGNTIGMLTYIGVSILFGLIATYLGYWIVKSSC
jgi:CrcB protein